MDPQHLNPAPFVPLAGQQPSSLILARCMITSCHAETAAMECSGLVEQPQQYFSACSTFFHARETLRFYGHSSLMNSGWTYMMSSLGCKRELQLERLLKSRHAALKLGATDACWSVNHFHSIPAPLTELQGKHKALTRKSTRSSINPKKTKKHTIIQAVP